MQLNEARDTVRLRLRNPSRVLDKIPTAQQLDKYHVDVPLNLKSARQLSRLEIDVPSPMRFEYDWPSRFDSPFEAQIKTACFATLHKRAFILNDLGTGKTLSVLWAYDYLRKLGQVGSMLVVAPLSTLDRAWADEVFQHFPHLDFAVCHGTRAKRRAMLLEKHDIYIINHDGVHIVKDILEERPDINLIVVDEISLAARNAQTRRWKALNEVINKQKVDRMAWGLTGTPTPNLPTDAWAQVKLIKPANVPFVFSKFRHKTMMQRGPFLWVPRRNATAAVKEIMKPAIRFSRDEVVDLPETMYESREVELTPDQKKAYRQMHTTLMAEAADGNILAVNEAVKASKLVQIACGVAYNTKGDEVTIDPSKRLKLLKETIDETNFKAIVFVPFVSTVNMVLEYLRAEGYTAECVYGGTKKSDRDRIFKDFQKEDNPRVLVAQPAAMSHGLTLTAANMIVWYAPVTSNDVYTQANGRITRPGQKNKQLIIHIEGTEIERKIFSRLKNKQNMQGILLDSVQASRS